MAPKAAAGERRARAVARRHHEEFKAWLLSHGVDMSKLKLVPSPTGLSWGAVAAARLPRGTTCASIPVSIALTEDAVLGSRVAADAKRLGLHPSTRTLTYVFMLLQRADRRSFHGPYLRAIPAQHTDPMGWSMPELAMLRGTNLLPQHFRRKAELRADFDGTIPALCDAFPARYSSGVLCWREFLWAHSSFVSRNLPLEPDARGRLRLTTGSGRAEQRQQCLLPLVDMLNHKYQAPIIWQSAGGDSCGGKTEEREDGAAPPTVGLAVGEDVQAGEEIFNNYGPKSQQELLRLYGFVLEENPQDTYELEVAGLGAEDDDELRAKQRLLEAMQLPRLHVLRRPTARSVLARGGDQSATGKPDADAGNDADDDDERGGGDSTRRKRKRARTRATRNMSGVASVVPPGLLRVLRLAMLNQPELSSLLGPPPPPPRGLGHADAKKGQDREQLLAAPLSGRSEMAALRTLLGLLRAKLLRLDDSHADAGLLAADLSSGRGRDSDATTAVEGEAEHDHHEQEKEASVKQDVGVRPFIAEAAVLYRRGQRELLELGIAECEEMLTAVAAATTHLHTPKDWRQWVYPHTCSRRMARVLTGGQRGRQRVRVRVSEAPRLDEPTCYGVYCHSVATATHAAIDAGVVRATADVQANGAVLALARSELISVEAAFAAGEWGEAVAAVGGIDEDAVLMLFLIHERSKQPQQQQKEPEEEEKEEEGRMAPTGSRWSPFFAQLETLSRNGEAVNYPPCAWSDAERALLAHTEAGEIAAEASFGLEDLHAALFPALTDAYPEHFPAETYSVTAMRWAAGVLAACSVQLQLPSAAVGSSAAVSVASSGDGGEQGDEEGESADSVAAAAAAVVTRVTSVSVVVPLIEASPRHRSDASCFHEYDAELDAYVLRTLRPLRCGEEVTVCRGRGGDAAALLGDSGTAVASCSPSSLSRGGGGCAAEDGHSVLLQVKNVSSSSGSSQGDEEPQMVAVKASVAEEGGGLLLWPPGTSSLDLRELRTAAEQHCNHMQAVVAAAASNDGDKSDRHSHLMQTAKRSPPAAAGGGLSEAAAVKAGRSRCGEVLLRCREHALTQLAVGRAVCDAIGRQLAQQA